MKNFVGYHEERKDGADSENNLLLAQQTVHVRMTQQVDSRLAETFEA